MTTCLNICFIC